VVDNYISHYLNEIAFNSLSRDHESQMWDHHGPHGGSASTLTFNSLSRDHSCVLGAHQCFKCNLSTPSLGITLLREGRFPVEASSFNSLSRDHAYVVVPFAEKLYELSTPSLGITVGNGV